MFAGSILALLAAGCGEAPSHDVGSASQATIWGSDDRRDWRETEAGLAELGRQHVGVLARRSELGFRATAQDAGLGADSRRAERGFCSDQPFLCQPRIGFCSATLIDGDLVATAGHCTGVPTPDDDEWAAFSPTERAARQTELTERLQRWCDRTMMVFNWREVDRDPPVAEGALPSGETGGQVPTIVTERDVYYCHEVLVHQFRPIGGTVAGLSSDVTLFTLKRDPAAGAAQPVLAPYGPAPVMADPRRPPTVSAGETVTSITFPNGLPMKFTTAPITTLSELWADTSMDILGGSSGGGLFAAGRHFAVVSNSRPECPRGTTRNGHYCNRTDTTGPETTECLVESQGPERSATSLYSLTYPAVDVLCGGVGEVPNPLIELPPFYAAGSLPRASYLCGTGAPVAPEPYVPSPVTPDPPPVDPGAPDPSPGDAAGCSATGNAGGAAGAILLGLALLFLRRRSLLAGCLGLAACAGEGAEPRPDLGPPVTRDAGPPVMSERVEDRYVLSYLRLPRSRDGLGVDLDGDGSIDSALGDVVDLFDSLGVSLSVPLMRAVDEGRLRWLLAAARTGETFTLDVYEGLESPLDPSGGGIYEVDPAIEPTAFDGAATAETSFAVEGGPLMVRIPLFEGVPSIELPLDDARIEGQGDFAFLEASLGGTVAPESLRDGLFRPLSVFFELLVAEDAGCPADCESDGLDLALAMIDGDGDGRLSVDELEGFEPLATRLAPDIDTDGDGVADALSIGVELEAVPGSFQTEGATRAKALVCFDTTCAPETDCTGCTTEAGCGWCEGVGCMPESEAASCELVDWRPERSACIPCEATSCGECAGSGFCSWCPGMGCINDAVPGEVAACGSTPVASPSGC